MAVTPACNLRCRYCYEFSAPTVGENRHSTTVILPPQELVRLARCAYEEGIRTFRITGGEPTLRRDLQNIVEGIAEENTQINIDTNGILLKNHLLWLINIKNVAIRFSIDGLQNTIEKFFSQDIYETILLVKESNIPARINMVVTKDSQQYVTDIIKIGKELSLDIKLLDLYYHPHHEKGLAYWREQFIPLHPIALELEKEADRVIDFNGNSDFGIPMKAYVFGNTKVIVKDAAKGTHLHPTCTQCPLYPCLEGFYSLAITSDGTLFPSGCWNSIWSKKIAYMPKDEIRRNMKDLLRKFGETRYSQKLNKNLREKLEEKDTEK